MKDKVSKLIVQIPAYNEQDSIAEVIKSIPKKISGISEVKILVIDDGSLDKTVENSKNAGADYIISNGNNKGLAFSFQRGLNEALKLGADIIVNTDADNQFNQKEIPKLVTPILKGCADLTIGNREFRTRNEGDMPEIKKVGNLAASNIVSIASEKLIEDASCGFRAYSKEAALRLFVLSEHTYTHETLIQSLGKNLKIVQIPIEVKPRVSGKSRLIRSKWAHTKKTFGTMIRSLLMYRSLKFFTYMGLFFLVAGLIPYIRWVALAYLDPGGDHIQSLILGMILVVFGGFALILGLLADLTSINRRYLEEILYRIRKRELK